MAGWAFVLLAVVEAVLVGQQLDLRIQLVPALIVEGDSAAVGTFLTLIGSLSTVLLPAAILYRARDAWVTHRLLLLGASLVAIWTVGVSVYVAVETTADFDFVSRTAGWSTAFYAVNLAGMLLLATGLVRLRVAPPTRRAHLATVLTIAALALQTVVIVIRPLGAGADALLIGFATAVAGGYALSVPIGAVLDRQPPSRFWVTLAVVSVALLFVSVWEAVALMLVYLPSNFTAVPPFYGFVLAAAALVTLVVFAREMPTRPGRRSD